MRMLAGVLGLVLLSWLAVFPPGATAAQPSPQVGPDATVPPPRPLVPISFDSVRFRAFGIRQGLSQATAKALVQDSRGFIWIGTQDGLNRFDGYEFRGYFRDRRDPSSLSDNHVTALELDRDGRIWVGTMAGGVNLFDPATEAAERFQPGGPAGLRGQQVLDLARDGEGRIWIASAGSGLQRFDAGSRRFVLVAGLDQPGLNIRAILPLPSGGLLLGGNRGLYQLDSAEGPARAVAVRDTEDSGPLDVWALAREGNGAIHVGLAEGGLLTLDAGYSVVARYQHQPQRRDSLPDNQVRSLLATRQGEVWVGTMNGVAALLPDRKAFLVWRYDGSDQATIAGNRTIAMLEDLDGMLWFGSWTNGLSVHNPATRVLRNARHMSEVSSSLPQNPVRALLRDADGSFWMGVLEGGGLVHYRREQGVIERHVHDPADPLSLPSDTIQAILRRRDGSLWVGTSRGLARYDGGGRFTRFRQRRGDPDSIGSNVIGHLYEDAEQRLWIGTEDGGVSMLCASCLDADGNARFERHRYSADDEQTLGTDSILSLAGGPAGRIWVGTYGGGLGLLDPATGKVRRFRGEPDRPGALNHDSITAIVPAASGGWWIGTQGGGVNRLSGDPLAGVVQFSAITKADGLGADAIGGVVEDLEGQLWISTTVGISQYDPDTGSVRNLSANDGLDRAGYFVNCHAREPDGTLLFGGLQGLVWFHPRDMRRTAPARPVVISDFRLFNAPVALRARDPRSPLPRGINYLDELVLGHDQDVWTMVFSSLSFAAPETARYSYWLEGYQDEWISSRGNFRVATYAGVPEGRYRFHVRGSNDDGLTWGPDTVLPLRVLAAPWRSWPAYAAYLLAALALGWLVLHRVRRNWQERQRTSEEIRRSQERLTLALWGSRDELWDLDLKTGEIFRENPNPRISLQSRTQFPTVQEYLKYVHPEDHDELDHALREHIEGRTQFYEVNYRMRGVDGDWVWVLGRGQAVTRSARGLATRMVGTNRDISALKAAEEELRRLNEDLEARVERRTEALRQANTELSGAMAELRNTQERLVETEKMASLGTLVAGVAHEINTPVGIGVTAASHLEQETRRFGQVLESGAITRTELNRYRAVAAESSELILRNLERASQLIKSFKQVAVDQSSEQRRQIFIRQYLEEILFALRPRLKRTAHQIEIVADPGLSADTFPGALYQIMVNLINNSLAHGFEDDRPGHVRIEARRDGGQVELRYADDGRGMNEETTRRVFEPFFTTKRGLGGSGLGMHIVYNLVTRMLGGTIKVSSAPGQGVQVDIRFPAAP